jgi:uncharacterized membrane protein
MNGPESPLVSKDGPSSPPATVPMDSANSNHSSAPHLRPRQLAVIAALLVAYAALSHYSNSAPEAKGMGAGLSIGPIYLLGTVMLWRWTRPLIAIIGAAGAGALMYRYWSVLKGNYEWSDLVQQCGAYTFVALSFGRTLFAGRVPMCTRLAAELHSPLAPAEVAYTRHATFAWAVFYFLLAAAILILFFAAPVRIWSLFVNFATFGLIGLMSVVDYTVRHHVLPRRPRVGIVALAQRILIG